jgi:leucyl-tRNA---protein transferase
MSVPLTRSIYGKTLDYYLDKGWFRMGRHIFTTDAIWKDETYHSVYWIRYNLNKLVWQTKFSKLFKQASIFETQTIPFIYNEHYENLYQQYIASRSFDGSTSLKKFLYDQVDEPNLDIVYYKSLALNIYHNKTIIASGVFDLGSNAIAGIINFYNPEYKKYSLGKLSMLLKLQFAYERGMQFYYPGYIVPTVNHFGYKTFIGTECIEVWDSKLAQWIEYKQFFGSNE